MPPLLHMPLQQHIGAHAEPEVKAGDKVKKGQVIALAKGMVSAPVHASTSGTILGIHEFPASHASGLPWQTITMKSDGKDEWGEMPPPMNPFESTPEEIAERVAISGVVGMGGATFPSAIKLYLGKSHQLKTLVINGSECEPYLTCDDRLMQEKPEGVLDGARTIARALKVENIIIAIESNKPDALEAMKEASQGHADVRVVGIPTRYPMGAEKHLIQVVTGIETPSGKLTADIGMVVHNVATAYAVHVAVRYGYPLMTRVVTVSGGAIKEPKNLLVPIGTPVGSLIDYCGGLTEEADRILSGGPMMGQPLTSTRSPIVKGTNGILALTKDETKKQDAMPCIRCGGCVTACPCGLVPLDMASRIRKEELDAAIDIGLMDCVSCGACAYVCPSYIPLTQYFNYAKGRLKAIQGEQRKQEITKKLAEQREVRLAEQMKAKKEMLAKRKAEKAAKAAALAAAKAAEEATSETTPSPEANP